MSAWDKHVPSERTMRIWWRSIGWHCSTIREEVAYIKIVFGSRKVHSNRVKILA